MESKKKITFNFIDEEDIYSIIPFLHMLHETISETVLKKRLDEMISKIISVLEYMMNND